MVPTYKIKTFNTRKITIENLGYASNDGLFYRNFSYKTETII